MSSNKTIPDMKEIFRQAAEIAGQVPETMQVAAFNRALDLLTGSIPESTPAPRQQEVHSRARSTGGSTPSRNSPNRVANSVDELIASIDTTQHPAVASATKVLDRALMILQIALRNHELDGLTPPEISRVLTEKFRLSTTSAAVNMALGPATTLVNRLLRGKAYEYRIMGPGEEYLSHLGSDGPLVVARSTPKPTKSIKRKIAKTEKAAAKQPNAKSPRSRAGPKEILEKLIASNYFSAPRDIAQIIDHLKTNHARTYKNSDLSPALTRLLRENRLDRNKNDKGIFQYTSRKT